MDELYTMERPRQMPVLPKICGAAALALHACSRPCAAAPALYAWEHSQVAPIELQLRGTACVQWSERAETMKIGKYIATAIATGAALMGVTLSAAGNPAPRTLEERVRHEILMVPYIGVFDNLSYQVDNGVVTLLGQVTQPVRKLDVERAVKSINGVTAVNDQIEVLPLSHFDDQIRVRTLRTLLRSASLDKYFRGVQPGIRIIVKNGDVTLDGIVLNSGDRQIAYMAANQVPGVFSVTNNLQTEK